MFYEASTTPERSKLYIRKSTCALKINGMPVSDTDVGPLPDYTVVELGGCAILLWRNQHALFKCTDCRRKRKRSIQSEGIQTRKRLTSATRYSGTDQTDIDVPNKALHKNDTFTAQKNTTEITNNSAMAAEAGFVDNASGPDSDSDSLASLFEGSEDETASVKAFRKASTPPAQITSVIANNPTSPEILPPSKGDEEAITNSGKVDDPIVPSTGYVDDDTETIASKVSGASYVEDKHTLPKSGEKGEEREENGRGEAEEEEENNEVEVEEDLEGEANMTSGHASRQPSLDDILTPPSPADAPTTRVFMGIDTNTFIPQLQAHRMNFIESMNCIQNHHRLYYRGTDVCLNPHRIPGSQPLQDEDIHLAIGAVWASVYQTRDVAFALSFYLAQLNQYRPRRSIPDGSFKRSSARYVLLPILLDVDPDQPTGIGHHLLCIAEDTHDPGGGVTIRLHFWDSATPYDIPSCRARKLSAEKTAEKMINVSKPFPLPPQGRYYFLDKHYWHAASRQQGLECGVHVILNAWAWLLEMPLCTTDPRKGRNHSEKTFSTSFYRTANGVINQALAGRMDEETMREFLLAYQYVDLRGNERGDGNGERQRGFRTRYTTPETFQDFFGTIIP